MPSSPSPAALAALHYNQHQHHHHQQQQQQQQQHGGGGGGGGGHRRFPIEDDTIDGVFVEDDNDDDDERRLRRQSRRSSRRSRRRSRRANGSQDYDDVGDEVDDDDDDDDEDDDVDVDDEESMRGYAQARPQSAEDDRSSSSFRNPFSRFASFAARDRPPRAGSFASSFRSYGSFFFRPDADDELTTSSRPRNPPTLDSGRTPTRRETRSSGAISASMPNPSSMFGGRRRQSRGDLEDQDFLSRSLNLSHSWSQSMQVKDLSVLRGARRTARAQMRSMATMAAAAVVNREEGVTPAAALVEMGGSSRLHEEEMSGSSTAQSIFNTVNILLGLGLLSLPYAMRCGGWIPCVLMMVFVSLIARYTGLILAKCMDTQPGRLFDFADVGEAAFGPRARGFVSVLFITELYLTCVAFVILVSDSLLALFPDVNPLVFRVVAFVVCTLSTWVRQLKYISYASLLGIFASMNLVFVVIYDGLTKPQAPGSLIEPERIYPYPERWISCSLSFGIIMAGFAGHAVLPNIYLDMRDKSQFPRVLNISFGIAFTLYTAVGVCGYLMFGENTLEEITKNLSAPGASPNTSLNIMTTWLIAFIPIPKFALTMAPVALALDQFVGGKLQAWSGGRRHPQPGSASDPSADSAPRPTSSTGSATSATSTPDHPATAPPAAAAAASATDASTISTAEASSLEEMGHAPTHAFGTRLARTPPRWLQLLLRALLALGTSCLPSVVPHFDVVLAILGSVFSVTVSVVIPAACYLKLFGGSAAASHRSHRRPSASALAAGGAAAAGAAAGAGATGAGSSGVGGAGRRRNKLVEASSDDDEEVLAGLNSGEGAAAGEGVGLLTGRVVMYHKGWISFPEWALCVCLVVFGSIGAVVATIGAALPESRPIGRE